jgi:predicted P-loop ATPase
MSALKNSTITAAERVALNEQIFTIGMFPRLKNVGAAKALGKPGKFTWKEFCRLLKAARRIGDKNGEAFVPCEFREYIDEHGEVHKDKVWRKSTQVMRRRLLVLDIEVSKDGRHPPDQEEIIARLKTKLAGIRYAIYSSHSHEPGKPRYRIVLPIADNVILDEGWKVADFVAEMIEISDFLDTSKVPPNSGFYFPSAESETARHFVHTVEEGDELDASFWDAEIAKWEAEDKQRRLERDARLREAEERRRKRIEDGDTGQQFIDKARAHIPSIAEQLDAAGYDQCGSDVWLYPGSKTGQPGVRVATGSDGVERVYSHHANDPIRAAGEQQARKIGSSKGAVFIDAVDLYCALNHGGDWDATQRHLAKNVLPSRPGKLENVLRLVANGSGAGTGNAVPGDAPAGEGEDDQDDEDGATTMDTKTGLILDSKRRPIANVANTLTVMRQHPQWSGVLGLDTLAGKVMLTKPLPHPSGRRPNDFDPRQLEEADIVLATEWFQHNDMARASKEVTGDAMTTVAKENSFDPLEDKLRSLVWDGTPRIDHWLVTYCKAEPTETQPTSYLSAVGKRWLLSAVARGLTPGCKADAALVLVGDQGTRKSTTAKILAYDWFTDALPAIGTKDASDHLRGHWIVEFGEMATASRADVEELKAFISRTTEKFRPPYGRLEVEYPRRNVFIGTSNRDEFLKDDTGNRRFWPVMVGLIDTDKLMADRDQLWAEAVHAFSKGEQWHLTGEEADLAKAQQAEFTIVDERLPVLAERLASVDRVRVVEALRLMDMPDERRHQMEIASMLRALGWRKNRRSKFKFWVAPEGWRVKAADYVLGSEDFG